MARWFAYELKSILKNVPATSGVYALHSEKGCVYVGEAEDICASLLVNVHDDNPCLDRQTLLYFTFESLPPEARKARQTELYMELHPWCLLREDFPGCQGCSLARKSGASARGREGDGRTGDKANGPGGPEKGGAR